MTRRRHHLAFLAGLVTLLAAAAPAQALTVWAVGDGAVPGREDDDLAARVEREGIDRFLYLGDVYESGTAADFANNYTPSWGRFKSITSPTPGNHEWGNRATGYDPYWGGLAPRTDGGHWYSFDAGGWHFVSLSSESDMGTNSSQTRWLRQDLSRQSGTCTIAFWHAPRYSAGGHGDETDTQPLWNALNGRAVAVLNGHAHNYQRFRPVNGITQFVVGSGGRRPLASVNRMDSRLAAANDTSLGALRLVLSEGRADWQFVGPTGARLDSGSFGCRPHAAEQAPPARPSVRIRAPRARTYRSRTRTFAGTSANANGAVRLTLVRRDPRTRRCSVFNGRSMRSAPCDTRRYIRVPGGPTWRYRLARMPSGTWRATARVSGAGGRTAAATVRFRIR